jgi:hypothetical protein
MDREYYWLHDIVDDSITRTARNNPKEIIENFFYIVDKKTNKVPFRFNEAQDEYYYKRTARDDILKARKEGFSSMILAIFTVAFLFLENVNIVCISHEDESTQRLFEKVLYYIENMEYDGTPIKVKLADKSRKRMVYKFKNKKGDTITNTFYVGTAGSKAFGRGDNVFYLHCSEIAFWDNASRIMTGLLNAVPDDLANTYIVKETTANGYGTQHQIEWENEKRGESVFKPLFFGWNKDPSNYMEVSKYEMVTGKKFIADIDEMKLAAKNGLSDGQLAWRRWKMSSMQPDENHTKEELFMQEFPIDDREAFLSSGKPIFDIATIEYYEEVYVKPPTKIGELIGWRTVLFEHNNLERLKVWDDPDPRDSYVISADVAESGDYCYATVVSKKTSKQMAEWHGHIDEFEFASVLYRLGMWYNIALIGVEKNNMGVAVIRKLDELDYPNQYVRESLDDITKVVHNELGWRTDSVTRPIMISDYNQEFTRKTYIFRSQLVADEMRTFVRKKTGNRMRPEAQSGCHDDAVIGNCIAVQLLKSLPETIDETEIIVRDYQPNNSMLNYN